MSDPALTTSLVVAFRHYGDKTTTPTERDAILATMSAYMEADKAQVAAAALHHRHEAHYHENHLAELLNARRPTA